MAPRTGAAGDPIRLAHHPTPVQPLDRLAAHLGRDAGSLVLKRDDLTGLGTGGNKARKLEHLCADALAQGCDTLVTGGGRQSNHARTTAAAAARLGLRCVLVLASDAPAQPTGNVILDQLLGAAIRWAGPLDHRGTEAAITGACDDLRAAGARPYRVPVGGASPTGCLGYVAAARELQQQVPDLAMVVVADGTGGTHAGLAAGLGRLEVVLGVDVGARDDLSTAVPALARDTAALAGLEPPAGRLLLDAGHVGGGYGEPSDDALEATSLVARLEGEILDPVYTAKAMAALLAAGRTGALPDGPVVFLHTGGLPALFAPRYASWVTAVAG